MISSRSLATSALLVFTACAPRQGVGTLRFHSQPVVWQVNDRADVPKRPADRPFVRSLYHTDQPLFKRIAYWMDFPAPRHAMNVNALDDVPDSTWFTNRVGRQTLTPAEVARGPNTTDGPDRSAPWQVISSKVGGVSIGFIIKDAHGDRYLLKFDDVEFPVLETATDVVVQRLLWAVGYFVPEDTIVYFDRSELVIAKDAEIKDVFGNGRPMLESDLDGALAKVRSENGRFRGLVSKFLPGIPIGGFPQLGVRRDDANDRIPHQHLRELRGLRVFYSWLQYTDAKENNTLDAWEKDPADPNRHYVVHYLVDFGKSLGANSNMARYYADGHTYMLDIVDVPLQLLSLGLVKRAWEGAKDPGIGGLAMFDAEHYDPAGFVPQDPYEPFKRTDDADGFWAAKILMRLDRAQIRAAVEQGQYEDLRAVDHLTDVLVARQRKAAAYWFSRVAPLDNFTIEPLDGGAYRVCFEDLSLRYRLGAGAANTDYGAASYDDDGRLLGWQGSARGSVDGMVCMAGLEPATTAGGYTMIRIVLTRSRVYDPVILHMATDSATGRLRIVGLRRY